MIAVRVQIQGLDALRRNFERAPALTLTYMARATRAALMEVDAQAIDPNMRFKTPRSKRTGQLVARWGLKRRFDNGGLKGATGPTVNYAPYVYYGTKRSGPNKYMDRVAKAAEPNVQKHFQQAVDIIVKKTAKI